ncbi:MAG: dihydropteroate synthase [Deltaproteobacteria bacterium]|nr:dihydropteroate synthase [Deltaproteobacteria bacterium]MBW2042106.1 dihydropteroate synthase [Deltaproteobacteria bacterium]MBW2132599.1 dihydropteroate synthase [Deltaproteobacteria bacterium]
MIIIGEKINATIPEIKAIIENRNSRELSGLARKQARAGAHYIDVNVGTGSGTREDEIDAMDWAVRVIKDAIDKALTIDSADPAVLEAGLAACKDRKVMVNSVKADETALETIIPLARRYDAALVALAMDETGIPKTVERRLNACRRIAARCREEGIPMKKIFFDPLVLPISTDGRQGKITLQTVSTVKAAFPEARTTLGLSNVSFGLPARSNLNAAFLHMAIYAGLDAVILDPLDKTLMTAVLTGVALMGKDRHFRRYTRMYRRKTQP